MKDNDEGLLREMYKRIKILSAKIETYSEPIAVIGMSCRFPGGANNIEEYWKFLERGGDGIIEVPRTRWEIDQYYDPDPAVPGKIITKLGGFLDIDISQFDCELFGMSPREVESLDPQHRLLLEVSYEAIHSAGIPPKSLKNTLTGVFIGICSHDYADLIISKNNENLITPYGVTGNTASTASGRIAFFFGFRGPNFPIDTACSSSLVAIDEACIHLRNGDANLALAGGVNLMLKPDLSIGFSKAGMLSLDGHCKTFDATADGYVRGEGCGIIVLKRLSDAIQDGNTILAVIKASGVNQDGPRAGLTVPNGDAQEILMRRVLEKAELKGADIDYLEAHGTGTSLGDPIEVEAIHSVYGEREALHPLQLGSVKTNIGHLEGAAGIASMIKVILALQHEMLPKHLHFKTLNPKIHFNFPVEIVTQNKAWERGERVRRAAVSSFGFSGTNAHIIVEEGPKLSDEELSALQERFKNRLGFKRQSYWSEGAKPTIGRVFASVHPLLGEKYFSPNEGIFYRGKLHPGVLTYLKDHQVYGHVIYPGSGYIEMMLAASFYAFGETKIHLSNISIEAALSFNSGRFIETQIIMKSTELGYEIEIYSQAEGNSDLPSLWHCHAKGLALLSENKNVPIAQDIEDIKARCNMVLHKKEFYEKVNLTGIHYGEAFQCLDTIYVGKKEALAELTLSISSKGYIAHPSLLESALQLLIVSLSSGESTDLFLPVACDEIQFNTPLGNQIFAYWQETEKTDMGRSGNLMLCDYSGKIQGQFINMHYRKTTEHALNQMLANENRVEEWIYEWDWLEKSLGEVVIPELLGNWLLLSDGRISDALKKILENKGAVCLCISPENHPNTKDDFLNLLREKDFKGILHLSSTGDATLTVKNIEKAQILGTKSLLELTQALVQLQDSKKIPLFVITRELFIETDRCNVPYSPLSGLFKTIVLEYPDLPIKLIDLGSTWDSNLLFQSLFEKNNENLRVLKEDRFYVPQLIKSNLRKVIKKGDKIHPKLSYLITGGLGGLSLTLLKWLLEKGATRLVLIGRRPLDVENKLMLKNLQTPGVKISYMPLDIADEKAVENLLKKLQNSENPLKGIFHLAGVLDDAILMKQDWKHFETVFQSKVYGSFNLHHYSKDLDFFVMFSSIASTLGSPGQSNYAAANAFMDALCVYRKGEGLPAQSLSWGPWAEVGMAKSLANQHANAGLLALNPKDGMRALEIALFSKQAHLSIANFNLEKFPKLRSLGVSPDAGEDIIAKVLSALPEKRPVMIETILVNLVKATLGLRPADHLALNKNLFDIGMDSLMGMALKNALQAILKKHVQLPTTLLFDKPTIAQIRDYLILKLLENAPLEIKALQKPALGEEMDRFPLSQAQERMLFLYYYESNKANYNLDAYIELTGHLNSSALHRALNTIVKRHEALRATFMTDINLVYQVIQPSVSLDLPEIDLTGIGSDAQKNKVAAIIQERRQIAFDLSIGPLIRTILIRLSNDKHIFGLQIHHICSDASSFNIIFKEIAFYYTAYTKDVAIDLPMLNMKYTDYARFELQFLSSDSYKQQLSYWQKRLMQAPHFIHLPTDYPRSKTEPFKAAIFHFSISDSLRNLIESFSRERHWTTFNTFISSFALLLHIYSGDFEINIGVPIANRHSADEEQMVGLFINTVVLNCKIQVEQNVAEFLTRMFETAAEAFANQQASFEKIVNTLKIERDLTRHPLIQVSFNQLPDFQQSSIKMGDLNGAIINSSVGTPEFDLAFQISDRGGGFNGAITYNANIFKAETIERLQNHYIHLIQEIIKNPECKLFEISVLNENEKQKILVEWNNTAKEYPRDKTIHQLFEDQVERAPNNIAVVFENQNLTYRELNEKSNQLAHYLREQGVGLETLVAILCERSLEMIIGIFAVLKAGAAYVPMDPSNPKERLKFMLEDTKAPILLTQSSLKERWPETTAVIIHLDQLDEAVSLQPTENLKQSVNPNNLACIIYTSGSTGKPKGVLIEHHGVVNYLQTRQSHFGLTERDRFILKTPQTFDVSVWEIFLPSIIGATLFILEPEKHKDAVYLCEFITRYKITIIHFVPSMLKAILLEPSFAQCKSLRQVYSGGEALLSQQVNSFYNIMDDSILINMYGPTEATIDVSYWIAEANCIVAPIGKPLDNLKLYILDNVLSPLPVGVVGELYLGGEGIARGYLNRQELTAERFIENPFATHDEKKQNRNIRLYRTGDLCRYLEDGNVEYLGRIDHQVKIRGYRIELGEIESNLLKHTDIQEAVVLAREDEPGNKRLVAYYVAKPNVHLEAKALRDYLNVMLPDYMVPSLFMKLDKMPLTPNGKLDRKALLSQEGGEIRQIYMEPRTRAQCVLAEIWQEILHLDKVGINDNFFELGGNSIIAVRFFSKIRQAMHLDLPLAELFAFPTIKQLAAHIESQEGFTYRCLVPLNYQGIKTPFFCIHPISGYVTSYIQFALELEGERRCYGLQSRGLLPNSEPQKTIPEMALTYIQEMKTVQAEGPYCLLGWSFGSAVAFEMAAQLLQKGERVEALIILDAKAPHIFSKSQKSPLEIALDELDYFAWSSGRVVGKDLTELLPPLHQCKTKEEGVKWVFDLLAEQGIITDQISFEESKQRQAVAMSNNAAFKNYQPPLIKVNMLIINASKSIAENRQRFWNEINTGKIEVYEVIGDHDTLMHEKQVQKIVKITQNLE